MDWCHINHLFGQFPRVHDSQPNDVWSTLSGEQDSLCLYGRATADASDGRLDIVPSFALGFVSLVSLTVMYRQQSLIYPTIGFPISLLHLPLPTTDVSMEVTQVMILAMATMKLALEMMTGCKVLEGPKGKRPRTSDSNSPTKSRSRAGAAQDVLNELIVLTRLETPNNCSCQRLNLSAL
jgi:hypothetical protein